MAGEHLDHQGNIVSYRTGPAVPTWGERTGNLLIDLDASWCAVCGLERAHWPGCTSELRRVRYSGTFVNDEA